MDGKKKRETVEIFWQRIPESQKKIDIVKSVRGYMESIRKWEGGSVKLVFTFYNLSEIIFKYA